MPVVVPVKFAFAARELWFDPHGLDIVEGDYAICATERGTEIGLVTADPFEVPASELAAPLKPVVRIADDDDLDLADELACKGEDSMHDFRRLVKKNGLDMKPVGVEYLFGGEKAVFYFAAEDRVDFRQLVRDLSSFFHIRVDMRQIGVRDETRMVGGFAHCGQELCCTRFGGDFEPVSIRMAKEQDLPLNSAKISGVCGRLMCCLRYEFEAYKDFKSRAPKKKTLIDTPLGRARIVEYNTPREQLVLRLESGKVFRVDLSDMTCSDENVKRCESQGARPRPDCVTRDVLERLDSPDLQLALLELDRQNGVDVGDGLSVADRIVTSGPTPRRRRSHEEASSRAEGGRSKKAASDGRGSKQEGRAARPQRAASEGQPAGQGPSRRRRGDAQDAVQRGAQTDRERQGQARRRRRHLSEADRDEAFRNAAAQDRASDAAPDAPRRRRHTAAAASGEGQKDQRERPGRRSRRRQDGKPDVPSVADQVSDGKVKVSRRRPGDGGGVRPVSGRPEAENASGAPASGGQQSAPAKRRRRRRSQKPRQDGGAGGGRSSRDDRDRSED